MPSRDPHVESLFDCVRRWALAKYGPTVHANHISIKLSREIDPVKMIVPPPPQEPGRHFTPMDLCVIEALREIREGETLTGERLARSAGYASSGRFRHALAALVRDGVIVNMRPGYRMPD